MLGLEDCGSLLDNREKRGAIAEEYPARRFLGIQQTLEGGGLGNAYWIPGLENPAAGLTEVKSDFAPLLGLLGSGASCLGGHWPLRRLPVFWTRTHIAFIILLVAGSCGAFSPVSYSSPFLVKRRRISLSRRNKLRPVLVTIRKGCIFGRMRWATSSRRRAFNLGVWIWVIRLFA